MKKLFSILSIMLIAALVMTSCKNNTATQSMINTDTVGLSAFRDWKVQQYQEAMNAPTVNHVVTPARSVATRTATRKTSNSYNSGSMNSSSTHTAQTAPVTKKRWSKAAKGAVIGGAGGAVLGAVINKRNRVAGGIIGGILGGGIGYGIGRSQDKKDGRY